MLRVGSIALAVLALAGTVEGRPAPPLPPGLYRLDMRLATWSEVPVLGRSRSAWQSLALVTIRSRRGRLVQQHRVCDARIEVGFPGVSVDVSPAFVAALAAPSYPVEIRDGRYRADFGIE